MDASNKFYHIATVTNFMSKLLGKRCDDFQKSATRSIRPIK